MRHKGLYLIFSGILVFSTISLILIVSVFTNANAMEGSTAVPSSRRAASTKALTIPATPTETKGTAFHVTSHPSPILHKSPAVHPSPVAYPPPSLHKSPVSQPSPVVQPTSTTPPIQAPAGQRVITFVNHMQQTIWVAATGHPLSITGWVLQAGQSVSTTIPDAWNGRFWGRTGCTFDANGNGHCETGDCASRFQCGKASGAVPATLAEFNLNSYAGLDFYDISLVDGSNLPMYINSYGKSPDKINANGCSAAGCTHNVNLTCPAVLQIKNSSGAIIACDAACNVFHTDQYCCRGAYASRSMCDPTKWPVDYAKIFKTAEPFAYSYPDDDATSTLTCASECNYRITFGVSG